MIELMYKKYVLVSTAHILRSIYRTQRHRGCHKRQSLKRWCCYTSAVVVTMAARLLGKSRASKCGFVSLCPVRSVLLPLLLLSVRSHRRHSTHMHAQADAPSVAVSKGELDVRLLLYRFCQKTV